MGLAVTTGATLTCTFGMAPCTLNVTSQMQVLAENKPEATIMDCTPANIPTFGMCQSLANPAVAAATAAAWGVLTPQPCTFAPAGTWIPQKPTVLINNKPCLTNDSQLHCAIGQGQITIGSPGQTKVLL